MKEFMLYGRFIPILILPLFIFNVACNKKNDVIPPIVDSVDYETDYSQYDLGGMAARSGSFITDTIFEVDDGRKAIIGYKLRKMADYDFSYPTSNWEKQPLINSYVSVTSSGFNLQKYLDQSASVVPRIYMSTYYPGEYFEDEVSVGSWEELYSKVKKRIEELGKDRLNQHKDYIYMFQSYEDLKLLFPDGVNIQSLFNIKTKDYPQIKNEGWLYYSERTTVDIKSLLDNTVFRENFSVEEMRTEAIARVWAMSFGKVGYMIVDAPEESKILVTKLAKQSNQLTQDEKEKINSLDVHFYLRGYTPEESQNIRQGETVIERIQRFFDLTINFPDEVTFGPAEFGVPLYYRLDVHSEISSVLKSVHYDREINFIQ